MPAFGMMLVLVCTILLSRAAGAELRRRLGMARRPAGSAAAIAGMAALAAALPAGAWFPHRPLLLPAALCVLCAFLAARVRVRRPVGGTGRRGRGDAVRDARTAARLAGLIASPSTTTVSRIVHRLALQAGADAAEADELRAAALLYDVGRAGLPDALPDAPPDRDRPLDVSEQRRLRRVPAIGARILRDGRSGLLDRAAEIALCHQECWDGSGYPRGLSGLQIPFAARVLSVAAVFDAVLSGHGDTPPRLAGQVLPRMSREAGRLLDPRLTRILLDDLPGMMQLHEHAYRTTAAAGRETPAPDAPAAVVAPPGIDVFGAAVAGIGHRAGPGFA